MSVAITSRQNPWFKRVREALREHRDEIVIEGPKQVDDAVRAGWKAIAIFRTASGPQGLGASEFTLSSELFDSLAETKSPQNVLALFARPHFGLSSVLGSRSSVVVALDAVQDPGNVGTIVRLAAAFDCSGVVLLPGCADAYSPKAIRASVGAALSVPIANATIADLRDRNLYAADARAKTTDAPARDAVFVFGSEGRGVSDEIRAIAKTIAIPMSPRIESLNVAAAAAIILSKSYEASVGR